MTTTVLASGAQISFIRNLLDDRAVEAGYREVLVEQIDYDLLTKKMASNAIDFLLKAPKATKEELTASGATPLTNLQLALAEVPKAKYAIHYGDLDLVLEDEKLQSGQDLYFFEVAEYMKTLYMRRLHGAPGGFSRTKLSVRDTLAILKIIKQDPIEHSRMFGKHYSVCGRCGAELTDALSRATQFGPKCRPLMGIVVTA